MPDVWPRILRLRGYSAREPCSPSLRSSLALPFRRASVSNPCTHCAPRSGISICDYAWSAISRARVSSPCTHGVPHSGISAWACAWPAIRACALA